ncbi:MAG: hypothetical protein ACFFFK_04375 [Candidatus Thorarchaeota archaeon]
MEVDKRDAIILILVILLVFLFMESIRVINLIPGVGEPGPDIADLLRDVFQR